MSELRITLTGAEAKLGIVPAADVARVLLAAKGALGRGCRHVIGRPAGGGRWGRAIEAAADLRLVAIEEGSLLYVLGIPEAEARDQTLLLETPSLGQLGASVAISALGDSAIEYPDVARVWIDLADDLRLGERYTSLTLTHADADGERRATIDAEAKARLESAISADALESVRDETLQGVLVEADFEAMTARLRTGSGSRVSVSFEPSLSDDIQHALRHRAALEGTVRFDREATRALSVRLRSVLIGEQLGMDEFTPRASRPSHIAEEDFWRERTVAELANDQSVPDRWSLDDLVAPDLSDEELESFLKALDW